MRDIPKIQLQSTTKDIGYAEQSGDQNKDIDIFTSVRTFGLHAQND